MDTSPEKEPGKVGLRSIPFKKIGEFVLAIWEIQRAVASLRADNKKLQDEISRLQRQVDDQAGQLKVLLAFVHTSLRDQVETQAERAAFRAVRSLVELKGEKSPEEER